MINTISIASNCRGYIIVHVLLKLLRSILVKDY